MKTRKGTGASFEVIGRLKEVPEIRKLESGQLVVNVVLAVDEQHKTDNNDLEDYVEWHRVSLWGKAAEFIKNHARAGMRLKISAKVRNKRKEVVVNSDGEVQIFYVPEFSANDVDAMDAIQQKKI